MRGDTGGRSRSEAKEQGEPRGQRLRPEGGEVVVEVAALGGEDGLDALADEEGGGVADRVRSRRHFWPIPANSIYLYLCRLPCAARNRRTMRAFNLRQLLLETEVDR